MAYLLTQPQVGRYPVYVVFHEALGASQCDALIAYGEKAPTERGKVGGDLEGARRSNITWLPWSEPVGWLYDALSGYCDQVRQHWYPFILSGFGEPLQLTHYSAEDKGHYVLHKDLGPGPLSNRKLSMVVLLSDPATFDGGEFCLLGEDGRERPAAELRRGTLIAFPSWEWHRVTPVTRGERWSLVSWVHGPTFT